MALVLIVPAALLEAANALGAALGHGPQSYSIALSPSGEAPASHFGLNLVEPDQAFLAMLAGAGEGVMPQGLEFPAGDFAEVMAGLISTDGEFFAVATANGLRIVEATQ
ncbi:hypothetical protein SZ64_07900 [Erythrobacter sp. SG61-1L]|uniref:hypothetical protein n=1 Tax=Erythrobacter sp. SG61-1L TaxID=1603897 RepID=UPI0006C914E9|nr:hypothetical protein [Erythrobacter sp. SG61-1L]KPL68049.1 hypothetical protein SZ64_07900 [Erythrobacter sp. SG61-1L]